MLIDANFPVINHSSEHTRTPLEYFNISLSLSRVDFSLSLSLSREREKSTIGNQRFHRKSTIVDDLYEVIAI